MNRRLAKFAVIDIGTLKSKFEIKEIDSDLNFETLYKDKKLTVLGRDFTKTNNLITKESIETNIGALKEFKDKMDEYNVRDYKAVATEAIRKAVNANEVLDELSARSGIEIEILEQEKEGKLLFEAVMRDFDEEYVAVADVGGGSVQLIVGNNEKIDDIFTFKTGTYFLQDGHTEDCLPSKKEIARTYKYIREQLISLKRIKQKPKYLVYGTSNIIDFFEDMGIPLDDYKKSTNHPWKVNVEVLKPMYDMIIAKKYKDRMKMFSKEPYYMWAADKALQNIFVMSEYLEVKEIIPSNQNISSSIFLLLASRYFGRN